MGEIIIRNWDLREFCVRVNWPSPIQQVWVPIRCVIRPIRGLPNPSRQVVPLISHIRSYSPYRAHLHLLSLPFSSTTLPSLQSIKLSHPSLSLHVMIMSWRQLQHTPSTAGGDGYECDHHVCWFRVERGGAACTLVLVYMSIRLSKSQWV